MPLGFVSWRKYDETPIKIRLRWVSDESADVEPQAKLMVVERSFGVLLQLKSLDRVSCEDGPVVLIRGHLTTTLRAVSSLSREAVLHILDESSPPPPPAQRLEQLVPVGVRSLYNRRAQIEHERRAFAPGSF